MKLVDASVWIDHFRNGSGELAEALDRGEVLTHPFVIGEIALGSVRQRQVVLTELGRLPTAAVARTEEVLRLIEAQRLWSAGIGYVDAHLLASVLLTPGSLLWSRDKRLMSAAVSLGVAVPGWC